jgi:hypothetical protein
MTYHDLPRLLADDDLDEGDDHHDHQCGGDDGLGQSQDLRLEQPCNIDDNSRGLSLMHALE